MRNLAPLLIIFTLSIFCSCEDIIEPLPTAPVQYKEVSGLVQKGPFLSGTAVVVSELNTALNPTGKNFYTDVPGNRGAYEVQQMEISSPFVRLQANGFYFNEVSGEVSSAPFSLFGLGDLTESSKQNLNVLTHLEKERVEYLVSQGYFFNEARQQAQEEVLKIFEIEKPDIKGSQFLDIAGEGDDNAILLAVSIITQGYRTEAELSELLGNIRGDIREDGTLDSTHLGSQLLNDISLIDLAQVRENIEERYGNIGESTIIPDFEKYVSNFINNTSFGISKKIEYPAEGSEGPNLLFPDRDNYNQRINNLTAVLPKGTSLKVAFIPTTAAADWAYEWEENTGWSASDLNGSSRTFYSTETDRKIELTFHLVGSGSARIEIYENGAEQPTRIKNISW